MTSFTFHPSGVFNYSRSSQNVNPIVFNPILETEHHFFFFSFSLPPTTKTKKKQGETQTKINARRRRRRTAIMGTRMCGCVRARGALPIFTNTRTAQLYITSCKTRRRRLSVAATTATAKKIYREKETTAKKRQQHNVQRISKTLMTFLTASVADERALGP